MRAASLHNFQISAATLTNSPTPKTFRCRSNKMQLQNLSVTTSTEVLLNICVCDFNLVMNSVIYSFIDPASRPDQDCTSSERLNFVRRYLMCSDPQNGKCFVPAFWRLEYCGGTQIFWKICKPRAQTT